MSRVPRQYALGAMCIKGPRGPGSIRYDTILYAAATRNIRLGRNTSARYPCQIHVIG